MKKILLTLVALASVSHATAQTNSAWTLRQCVEYAIEHNITVKQRENSVKASEVELSTARNSRLPDLHASANQSFNFGRGLTSMNTYTNRNTQSTGFDMGTSVPLYTGGQISGTIAVSRINLEVAMADLERAREDISLQVVSTYLQVLYQRELLNVAKEQLNLSKEQLRRIEVLYNNGKASSADVAEARAAVANDELSVTQQNNAHQLALLDLVQLLEINSPEGFDIDYDIIADTSLLPDSLTAITMPSLLLTEQRPALRAEVLKLQGAQRSVRTAKSGYYPNISLSAGLGSSYYKTSGFQAESFGKQLDNNFNRYVGVSLSVPVFNRFSTRNSVRQARLQVENQQLTLENTRNSLYKEMQQAYYNALAAQRQYCASSTAADAAQEAFRLVQHKYENGKATQTEYEESRTRMLKAVADLIQAKYTYIFRSKILNFYQGEPLC